MKMASDKCKPSFEVWYQGVMLGIGIFAFVFCVFLWDDPGYAKVMPKRPSTPITTQAEPNRVRLGRFKLTFYDAGCQACCGRYARARRTASGKRAVGPIVAVDPKVVPLGTRIFIEGIGWRMAEDTGSAIKGRRIDVLVASHSEARRRGVERRDVWVVRD